VALNDYHLTPDDPQLVFEPKGLHICDTPQKGHRILYVHRKAPTEGSQSNPLAIDLADLSVSIAQKEIFFGRNTLDFPVPVGLLGRYMNKTHRQVFDVHIPHWENMNRAWPDTARPSLCHGSSHHLLYYDGWFYEKLGFRIHEKTWKYEYLTNGLMPSPYDSLQPAVSAHYGLVAWRRSTEDLYRVTIAPAKDREDK
jgi:hypothetical protein